MCCQARQPHPPAKRATVQSFEPYTGKRRLRRCAHRRAALLPGRLGPACQAALTWLALGKHAWRKALPWPDDTAAAAAAAPICQREPVACLLPSQLVAPCSALQPGTLWSEMAPVGELPDPFHSALTRLFEARRGGDPVWRAALALGHFANLLCSQGVCWFLAVHAWCASQLVRSGHDRWSLRRN